MLNVHPWIDHFARWFANRVPPLRLRQDVDQAAHDLIARYGDAAYEVARAEARNVPPGTVVDRSQRQQLATLARVPALSGQAVQIIGVEVLSQRHGSGHGKPSRFASSNQTSHGKEIP